LFPKAFIGLVPEWSSTTSIEGTEELKEFSVPNHLFSAILAIVVRNSPFLTPRFCLVGKWRYTGMAANVVAKSSIVALRQVMVVASPDEKLDCPHQNLKTHVVSGGVLG